ncbi:hypothetical protein Enr13x_07330 [Stieleria neptunia]|uniref:Uncharacterized protein n=1 Tax=Stieleria neptunia TaxID=2527979 RepID=A0A518HJ68_9BACT|nr:hypothetical protein [Stieleria neptunia]QDV40897.1 hypothetical protein Enr13x_07330 [Stieleria neptunia]
MIKIDSIEFDFKRGDILLPEPDAIPFRSQSIEGIGIQKTQERSPGFTLTLIRFAAATALVVEKSTIVTKIGTTVSIVERVNGADINWSAPGGHKFVVTQARMVDWKVIPGFYGYRGTTYGSFTPALRMVSQWTMYAIENPVI